MKLYGLIGFPLTHSKSAEYFNDKFRREGDMESSYRLFPLKEIGELPGLIAGNTELFGLNVTIPYKVRVVPYLGSTDDLAASVGAVNTIKIVRQGGKITTRGFNTDVEGFLRSLPGDLPSGGALILGTGGAAQAVACALRMKGIPYNFVSRNPSGPDVLSYPQLTAEVMHTHTLIFNATPVGMYPDITGFPPLPYALLSPGHFLYDLVYNPAETAFLLQGKARRCRTMNGYAMLVEQAELAWKHFRED
jgi:shikimate dehydrogenase